MKLLIILQFITGNIKLFDVIYFNNLIFLMLSSAILIIYKNKIKSNLLILILIYIFYILLQNLSFNSIKSLVHLYIFLIGPIITYLYITNEEKLNNLILSFNYGCFIIGIISLVQIINWISSNGFNYLVDGEFFRISGLSTSPTDLVTQLTVGLALSSAIKAKFMRTMAYMFYIVLLLFTMSRSAIVVLGIFAISELTHKKSGIILRLMLAILVCMAIFASPLWPLIQPRIIDIGNSDINIHRYLVYEDIFNKSIGNLSSFLFGSGFGTYEFYHPISNEIYNNPHNIFLFILYSAGLVGLILFIIYIIYILKLNFECLVRSRDLKMRILLRQILVLQIATWIVGMVETNILGIGAGWILGLIFGIPLAINSFHKYES